MKKILILVVMLSMLIGVVGVMADTEDQTGSGTTSINYTLIFDPLSLTFDPMVPGGYSSLANQITIGTSPLKITDISVSPIVGTIFDETNVLFSNDNVAFVSATDFGATPISIAAQGSLDFFVQMNIPIGTLSGPYEGTITYTVMEDI